MLKTLTWISVGISILGALMDFGGSDQSGLETAAEVAMLARLLGTPEDATPPGSPRR